MKDQQSARLIEAVRGLAEKARSYREQYRERGLGEANTKASLIEPILEALGWNIRDVDEVYREFRPNPKDNPVDYCLRLQRDTRLLIEAKGLGEDMRDRRWIAQTLGYATMAGAKWCVLTDGDEYLIYNATEAVDADAKLFCRIKLSDGQEEEAVSVLALISRGNVEKDVLSSLWKSHFVDRRVKAILRELVDTADRKLVLLIRRRTGDLLPKEIVASLRRLDIRIEAPESPYELGKGQDRTPRGPQVNKPGRQKSRQGQPRRTGEGKGRGGITLADLIAAGILTPPLKLFRKYKGKRLEATLLAGGAVEFQGQRYNTCSGAPEAARATVSGQRMNTNGWVFWQYEGAGGKKLTLRDARRQVAPAPRESSSEQKGPPVKPSGVPRLPRDQARALQALLPVSGEPSSLSRAELAQRMNVSPTGGTINAAMRGRRDSPHKGLLDAGLVAKVKGEGNENTYQITTAGIKAIEEHLKEHGELPLPRDKTLSTNIRYQQQREMNPEFGTGGGAGDPHNLSRFVQAQEGDYEQGHAKYEHALAEIRSGQKCSHWMWYIFPQLDRLGVGPTAKYYGIKSIEEARAYLAHPVLGPRLRECAEAAASVEGHSAKEIFGSTDEKKLKSCATLFACVSPAGSVFHRLLDKYFKGGRDRETLRLLGIAPEPK